MKRVIIYIIILLSTFAGGIWLGYQVNNSLIEQSSSISVTCGGGDYPKEAFRVVNEEIEDKIESLLDEKSTHKIFIAVVPSISGYEIRLVGDGNSKIFEEDINNQLIDWISQRMDEIYEAESAKLIEDRHNGTQ
jgi:hypothetical protein